MARSVTDTTVMLSTLTKIDPKDPTTTTNTNHIAHDYTQFLDRNALRGKRFGVWRTVTHKEYTAVYPPLWEMACGLVVRLRGDPDQRTCRSDDRHAYQEPCPCRSRQGPGQRFQN